MKLRDFYRKSKSETLLYRLVLKDPRTPRMGKILLGIALFYFFFPFDILPDFIPVLGQLDEIIIIPILILIARSFIPKEIIEENRKKVK